LTDATPDAPSTIRCFVAPTPGQPPAPEERPAPPLGADDLLVAVEACVLDAPERATLATRAHRAPGGAAVGRVVAAGVAAGDHLGRRVLVGPLHPCGECDACRRGRLAACAAARRLGEDTDGALASHVVARRRWVCPLDGPLAAAAPGPEAALLAREAPLAYALVARAGVAPGDVVVWLGAGVTAALGARLAAIAGCLVAHLPAAPGGDPVDAARAVLAAGAAQAAAVAPPAAWRVLVAGTDPAALATALALAAHGATVGVAAAALAAAAPDAAALTRALAREAVLFGLEAPHPDLVPEVAALAARGELVLAPHALARPIGALADALVVAAAPPPGQAVVVTM
jgi:6-hydroxycyclohex-1-ene-1-carbonyl-CoA dehydrogenase